MGLWTDVRQEDDFSKRGEQLTIASPSKRDQAKALRRVVFEVCLPKSAKGKCPELDTGHGTLSSCWQVVGDRLMQKLGACCSVQQRHFVLQCLETTQLDLRMLGFYTRKCLCYMTLDVLEAKIREGM